MKIRDYTYIFIRPFIRFQYCDSSGLYIASNIAEERYFRMMKFRNNVFFRRASYRLFLFLSFSLFFSLSHFLSLSHSLSLSLPFPTHPFNLSLSSPFHPLSLSPKSACRVHLDRHARIDDLGSYLAAAAWNERGGLIFAKRKYLREARKRRRGSHGRKSGLHKPRALGFRTADNTSTGVRWRSRAREGGQ